MVSRGICILVLLVCTAAMETVDDHITERISQNVTQETQERKRMKVRKEGEEGKDTGEEDQERKMRKERKERKEEERQQDFRPMTTTRC